MKLTWILLTAIYSVSSVSSNFPTVNANGVKKDFLVVIAPEYPGSVKILRNSSGHQIGLEGVSPLILEWLSRRYKFGYSFLWAPASVTTLEDLGPKFPGFISFVLRGESDLIITVVTPLSERLRVLDLVHPWFYTQLSFLVPMSENIPNNVSAIIKPFQFWVWMGLLIASAPFFITMKGFNKILKVSDRFLRYNVKGINLPKHRGIGVTEEIGMYIIRTLLSQGGYISCKITSYRSQRSVVC